MDDILAGIVDHLFEQTAEYSVRTALEAISPWIMMAVVFGSLAFWAGRVAFRKWRGDDGRQ